MTKHIAMYCRISFNKKNHKNNENTNDSLQLEDTNSSIENQKKIISEYIKQMYKANYDISNVVLYEDIGYSGTNLCRPGIRELLYDIERDNIDIVVVKDISRVSRNYLELDEIIRKCIKHRVELISVIEGNYTHVDNNMYREMRALLADFYSKDISIKTKSVLDMKKKNGAYKLPRLPFGYMMKNNEIVIVEDEKKVVQRIYELYIDYKRITYICDILDKDKVLTPSEFYIARNKRCGNDNRFIKKKWTYTSVRNILSNEFYIGTIVYNKTKRYAWDSTKRVNTHNYIKIENHHKSIIDKEIFELVQYHLNNRNGNN